MKKKALALLLACIMMLAAFAPMAVLAASTEEGGDGTTAEAKTESVTLHKILMTKENLSAWESKDYDGKKITDLGEFFDSTAKEISGVYFAWQKEFNGVWKYIKSNGTAAMAQSPDAEGFKTEVLGGLTGTEGFKFITADLPAGDYKIVEIHSLSNYTGDEGETLTGNKAVPVEITLPVVNNDGVVKDAHVYPKNTEEKPKIDKNFVKKEAEKYGLTLEELIDKGVLGDDALGADYENYQKKKATATASEGKIIPYEVITLIPQNQHYKHMIWKDTMTEGLDFNKDLTIEAKTPDLTGTAIAFVKGEDYTVTEDARGFTLTFTDAGLTKLSEKTKDASVEFKLTYTATVTKAAIIDNPEENDVTFFYGNNPYQDHEFESDKVKTKKVTVKKVMTENPKEQKTFTFTLYDAKTDKPVVKQGIDASKTLKVNTDGTMVPAEIVWEGLDLGEYYVKETWAGYTVKYEEVGNEDAYVITVTNTESDNPEPLRPTTPKVVTGGKKFVKTDNVSADNRLAGAKFVIKKSETGNEYLVKNPKDAEEQQAYETAKATYLAKVEDYNTKVARKAALLEKESLTTEEQQELDGINTALAAYDQDENTTGSIANYKKLMDEAHAVIVNNGEYIFKEITNLKEAVKTNEVVVLTSNNKGQFEITHLAYGTYFLEEVEAPKDFAKLSGLVEFTIGKGSYTTEDVNIAYETTENAPVDAKRIENKKVTIPQTGGIGTIIFTVAGLAIMGTAAMSLFRKKEATN